MKRKPTIKDMGHEGNITKQYNWPLKLFPERIHIHSYFTSATMAPSKIYVEFKKTFSSDQHINNACAGEDHTPLNCNRSQKTKLYQQCYYFSAQLLGLHYSILFNSQVCIHTQVEELEGHERFIAHHGRGLSW